MLGKTAICLGRAYAWDEARHRSELIVVPIFWDLSRRWGCYLAHFDEFRADGTICDSMGWTQKLLLAGSVQ